MSRATALASRFMEIADAKGGEEGLADAVQEIEETLETEDLSGLAQHAVKLFLAHHKEASEKLDRGSDLRKSQGDTTVDVLTSSPASSRK